MKSLVNQTDYMQFAIAEAIKAKNKQEVPVGAVIVNSEGQVIAKAHNLVETKNNPLCHAEKLVIEKALKFTGKKFLIGCHIWVTLEPCAMCASIIKQARISRLYYGAEDKKGGAIDNGPEIFSNNDNIEIYSGFSADKSEIMLKTFFKKLR
ncbi:nucleoside deaminase [Alphaproteobacteria bacterium]|jgi:tRNA(adenine34) deaminase|nr:nucleoside deaminase [Alphaproteobacteria bacterium]